ncbi:MAG: ATP synthase A1 subunit C [Coriobacteriia bacterium]|nr:ATP synthase A1 subunit C [Coriobacteriia bacterium]
MSTTSAVRPSTTGRKDYGYSNARVRGMRARLLNRSFYDTLIEARDIQQMIQELTSTGYGPDLEEVLIKGRDAAVVDEALKNNLVRTYRKILGFLNDEGRGLATTLLGRWDVFNIKTILRGKHMRLPAEEVGESLVPAGQLSEIELNAMLAQDDVKSAIDAAVTLGLPYAAALRYGIGEYAKTGELAGLELSLDRHYAEWATKRLSRRGANAAIARRILGTQIDIVNLLTVFRMQKADIESLDVAQFHLPGGLAIGADLFEEVAGMSDVDQVLDRLRNTMYGPALEDAAMKYIEVNSLSVFERALEDHLIRKVTLSGVHDPLGVGVVVSYLTAKQNEITNLRIIVKGKSIGMPVERVREELILV